MLAQDAAGYADVGAKTPLKSDALFWIASQSKPITAPAGGLFSTATDVSRFCRMVLNGGTLDGKRVLSEAAVKEMTTRQTPMSVKESYGRGWSVGGGTFGHGGFPGDGAKAQGAFRAAAEARFGGAGK